MAVAVWAGMERFAGACALIAITASIATPQRACAAKGRVASASRASDAGKQKNPREAPASAGASDAGDGLAETEFTRCEKYPAGRRFRLALHGEVGVAELVAVVGEVSCRTILVGSA